MAFNELNSVEYFIIHQLTGVNLNQVQQGMVKEEPALYGDAPKWKYVQPELLPQYISFVLFSLPLAMLGLFAQTKSFQNGCAVKYLCL